jgi:hypothetical protein
MFLTATLVAFAADVAGKWKFPSEVDGLSKRPMGEMPIAEGKVTGDSTTEIFYF